LEKRIYLPAGVAKLPTNEANSKEATPEQWKN
jgi:hypothetical protein